jgi:hypothetical protein
MHEAACFFRGQRTFSQVMAFFMLNQGKAELAEPYARDYHARTPDKADALLPLLLTLHRLGRRTDIREIVAFEAANANAGRLGEIRAMLEGIADLREYMPAPAPASA